MQNIKHACCQMRQSHFCRLYTLTLTLALPSTSGCLTYKRNGGGGGSCPREEGHWSWSSGSWAVRYESMGLYGRQGTLGVFAWGVVLLGTSKCTWLRKGCHPPPPPYFHSHQFFHSGISRLHSSCPTATQMLYIVKWATLCYRTQGWGGAAERMHESLLQDQNRQMLSSQSVPFCGFEPFIDRLTYQGTSRHFSTVPSHSDGFGPSHGSVVYKRCTSHAHGHGRPLAGGNAANKKDPESRGAMGIGRLPPQDYRHGTMTGGRGADSVLDEMLFGSGLAHRNTA